MTTRSYAQAVMRSGATAIKPFIVLALCVAAACDSPTVPERFLRDVYDFRLITPAPQVLRWPTGTKVRVFTVTDPNATIDQYLQDAMPHGVAVWNTAALYGEVELEEVDDVATADVVVMYSLSTSPVDLSGCPPGGGNAFTTFCLTPDNEHLRVFPLNGGGTSSVKFVVTVRTSSATDATTVRRLVAHELGHVLGIAQHSPKQTDLMWGGVALQRDDASPADRSTLQVLYHTRADITP